MSGIFGFRHLNGRPAAAEELRCMQATMPHRGPDGSGTWLGQSVGFGHLMLWNTPEATREHLPSVAPSGCVITADARLDNRDELLCLASHGKPAGEVCDSELILAAYEKWGVECADHLVGDFAFAIWDPTKEILLLARDPVGAKPLFYFSAPGRLVAFASEIKGLLALPGVPHSVNEFRIAEHLVPTSGTDSTFYKDIFRVRSGHCVIASPEPRSHRYWRLNPRHELRLRSNEEYAEAFLEQFSEAVRCRLRSYRRVGSTLSGGLDSSSVACISSRILADRGAGPLPVFSATWDSLLAVDPEIDEHRFINAVLKKGGFEPHFVPVDQAAVLDQLEEFQNIVDGPSFAPNQYMYWWLYGAVREAGVGTILTGNDGDTALTYGLGYLRELAQTGRWMRLKREADAFAKRRNSRIVTTKDLVWNYGVKPLIPSGLLQTVRRLRGYPAPSPSWVHCRTLNPSFVERLNLRSYLDAVEGSASSSPREAHIASLGSALIQQSLELLEGVGAVFGIEPRHPFFDRRLLDFCVAVPNSQKLEDGWTRMILRRAMEGILPPEVQWRVWKGKLGAHFKKSLAEGSRPMLDRAIHGYPEAMEKYIDLPKLARVYSRYLDNPLRQEEDAFTVFLAVALHSWLTGGNGEGRAAPQMCNSVPVTA